jgi:hypothetical protein
MCSEPVMRAPFSGFDAPNSARSADGDFATAEFGEAQVLDGIIGHGAIPVDESWSWRSPIGHGLCAQV